MEFELKRKEDKTRDVAVGDMFKSGDRFYIIKKIPKTQKYTGIGLGHEHFYGIFDDLEEMNRNLVERDGLEILLSSEYDYKLSIEAK